MESTACLCVDIFTVLLVYCVSVPNTVVESDCFFSVVCVQIQVIAVKII